MIDKRLTEAAERTLDLCKKSKLMVATAESCTGGLIAASLTAISGSSAVVDRGLVTYTNEAKEELLGVPKKLLETYGAVSEPIANAMAAGALARSRAQISVAVTGIAGPGGGSEDKPVGLVHLAAARTDGKRLHLREVFSGDRDQVRAETVLTALQLIERLASE